MSAIAAVVMPLEAGTPVVVICRDKFVAHKIALTRMESLICVLHLPEPNELNEPSPVQARSAWQGTSRAASVRFAKPAGNFGLNEYFLESVSGVLNGNPGARQGQG